VDGPEWQNQFLNIPGIAIRGGPAKLPLLDFGSEFEKDLLCIEPPQVLDAEGYPTLVPAVDDDGNDRGCLNAQMVLAPLATFTGWNLRARGQGAKYQFSGSIIPFPETQEERQVTADPRASIL